MTVSPTISQFQSLKIRRSMNLIYAIRTFLTTDIEVWKLGKGRLALGPFVGMSLTALQGIILSKISKLFFNFLKICRVQSTLSINENKKACARETCTAFPTTISTVFSTELFPKKWSSSFFCMLLDSFRYMPFEISRLDIP